MEIRGEMVLAQACRKNPSWRSVLAAWQFVVEQNTWRNLQDIRASLPATDGVKLKSGTVITVFNIKGNTFRLLAQVEYFVERVQVLEVLTHSKYSTDRWKLRY